MQRGGLAGREHRPVAGDRAKAPVRFHRVQALDARDPFRRRPAIAARGDEATWDAREIGECDVKQARRERYDDRVDGSRAQTPKDAQELAG